jgi:asparagine synthase (glutamine-hydrolysing)
MPGIAGGTADESTLTELIEPLQHEDWYCVDRQAGDAAAIGVVHHGPKDPGGVRVWDGKAAVGACYGAITENRTGLDGEALPRAILESPAETVAKLDGCFLIACASTDEDRFVVATDRLGTRSCYYATDAGECYAASELKSILPQLPEVSLDERAAGDILALGWVLGDKTLVEGVNSLPPATALVWEDGEATTQRYWVADFRDYEADSMGDGRTSYAADVASAFREMSHSTADTVSGQAGLFLSGGIDSRTLAATLSEDLEDLTTITFDRNPPDESNVGIARAVAGRLGVENDLEGETPERWGELVPRAVGITDGMASWEYFLNPRFAFEDLHDKVDVIVEASTQGELLGEQPGTYELRTNATASGALVDTFSPLTGLANDLLDVQVDTRASFEREVERSNRADSVERALDVWLRNTPSNSHYLTKKVHRSQVGMRFPYAHEAFLDVIAAMPLGQRRTKLPFTNGVVPRSMSPLKPAVLREIDPELATVPYERTRLPPTRPLALHDATYVAKQLWWRFVSGRPTKEADWLRDAPAMRDAVDEWIDAACDRDRFDAATLRRLRREHQRGEANHLAILARVTTLELWLQAHVDGSRPSLSQQAPAVADGSG